MGNPYPFIDAILPLAAEMHEEVVLVHYERRLAEDAATIADLRDQNERMRRLLDYVQQTAPGVLVAAHVNAGKP